jgi:hypothetical protein
VLRGKVLHGLRREAPRRAEPMVCVGVEPAAAHVVHGVASQRRGAATPRGHALLLHHHRRRLLLLRLRLLLGLRRRLLLLWWWLLVVPLVE